MAKWSFPTVQTLVWEAGTLEWESFPRQMWALAKQTLKPREALYPPVPFKYEHKFVFLILRDLQFLLIQRGFEKQ